MKIFLPFSLWLALSAPVSWAADGPPVESKISTGVGSVQSVFNLPTNSKEGRDPFFPESTRALCDEVVKVPIHGRAESLNLATAAAVCLYASARAQRR